MLFDLNDFYIAHAQPNRGQEPANAHRSGMFCMKFFRNSDMASGSEKMYSTPREWLNACNNTYIYIYTKL